jgi:hypothetical protein
MEPARGCRLAMVRDEEIDTEELEDVQKRLWRKPIISIDVWSHAPVRQT